MIDGQDKGFVRSVSGRRRRDIASDDRRVARGRDDQRDHAAIDAGIGLSVLAAVIHAYPTQAGAIKPAADAFATSRMKPPPRDISRPEWPTD